MNKELEAKIEKIFQELSEQDRKTAAKIGILMGIKVAQTVIDAMTKRGEGSNGKEE